MDRIEAAADRSSLPKGRETLYIFLNGERLDLLLSLDSGFNFRDLIPSWLYLAGAGPDAEGMRAYIAERSKLDNGEQVLPILLGPDDFSLSGTSLVVDVGPDGDQVHWRRFGLTWPRPPGDAGEEVQWIDGLGPFHFGRRQYLDCLEAFQQWRPLELPPEPRHPGETPSICNKLFAVLGAVFSEGSGAVNLPALAYRQVQSELTESQAPPEWSFARLLPVTGVLALGIDPTGRYIMTIGPNGREVFNLNTGRREAKSDGRQILGGAEAAEAEGIGPLAGLMVPLWGRLGRKTSPELLRQAKLVGNGLSPIQAVLSADEGRRLIVAQEDGLYIFHHV